VFLASADALRAGGYALAELGIAERRWPRPAGHVLPVLVDATPLTALPPFLRAVSVLVPQGDVVAEVVDAVVRQQQRRRHRWRAVGGAGAAVAVLVAAFVFWRHEPPGTAPARAQVWTLKNGHHVRLQGRLVANGSNVADAIVRDAVEADGWRYGRCYDASFGAGKPEALPAGEVELAFDILDQLPRHAAVARSDFADPAFDRCVLGTLVGQTINAAGAGGAGPVRVALRFVPN
jgi:hypothetical protein